MANMLHLKDAVKNEQGLVATHRAPGIGHAMLKSGFSQRKPGSNQASAWGFDTLKEEGCLGGVLLGPSLAQNIGGVERWTLVKPSPSTQSRASKEVDFISQRPHARPAKESFRLPVASDCQLPFWKEGNVQKRRQTKQ